MACFNKPILSLLCFSILSIAGARTGYLRRKYKNCGLGQLCNRLLIWEKKIHPIIS